MAIAPAVTSEVRLSRPLTAHQTGADRACFLPSATFPETSWFASVWSPAGGTPARLPGGRNSWKTYCSSGGAAKGRETFQVKAGVLNDGCTDALACLLVQVVSWYASCVPQGAT